MGGLLEVSDISVAFGGVRALAGVSVSVTRGSIVGLIGPNGAGKTTLFNVISGLQSPDSGTIVFDGNLVTSLKPHERAGLGMGRSFQHLGLINDETVATNIMAAQHLGAEYRGWDVALRARRWWSQEARLREQTVVAATAFGLADRLEERVADLSFGLARFAELACVLVGHPRLMLLDEPTTGLDAGEIARLLQVLQAQRDGGTTILLVAHDVRFVMDLCDHVYVLAGGRVLFEGSPTDVQHNPKVIEAYLGRSA